MTARKIVTAVLLLFVAVSVGTLLVQEIRRSSPATAPPTEEGDKVVAFYFYTNIRCKTCETLEAYGAESIRAGFRDEVESGLLEWRAVNTDDDENAHYVDDYQLITKSLVLARFRDGKQVAWKNLEAIWDLVDDKDAFLSYVREETLAFLRSRG